MKKEGYIELGGKEFLIDKKESLFLSASEIRFVLAATNSSQTLQTIASRMGVTRERVRQIEAKFLERMADFLKL